MAGLGWSCKGSTCLRSDPLKPGFSYAGITVRVTIAANAPSSVTNNVSLSGGGSAPASASDVTTIGPATIPTLTASAITNAATLETGAVAPGEMITIFGSDLGSGVLDGYQLTSDGRMDTVAGTTHVFFDSVPAPIVYAQAGQLSAIVPYAVAGESPSMVHVEHDGIVSPSVSLVVAATAPGLFTADSSGTGQASIVNQDGTVNSAAFPAPPDSIVVLYATGEGHRRARVGLDGEFNATVFPTPLQQVSLQIGGEDAEILYAGAAPQEVSGVLQVNARVPADVTPGDAVPVVLSIGGVDSRSDVTMAILGPDSSNAHVRYHDSGATFPRRGVLLERR